MIRYIRQRHIGVKESHRLLLLIAHGLFEYLEEVTLGQRITPCLKILLNSGTFSLITDQMFVVHEAHSIKPIPAAHRANNFILLFI